MVYAGRLDPMAEGLLLVLTGADRFDLPAHLKHEKQYIASILFGVESDTHDALGRLRAHEGAPPSVATCTAAVAALRGTHSLPLPAWSAFRVGGRPLHAWARDGRLDEIAVPDREMVVTAVDGVVAREVRPTALLEDVVNRITQVRGDFRQAQAVEDWKRLAAGDRMLAQVTATLDVTSGTYVRALAHALGTQLGCGGLLFALRRTRVGPYSAAELTG